MLTKYPGVCFRCHKEVPAGKGDIQKTRKKGVMEIRSTQIDKTWLVRCFDCKGKGNEPLPANTIANAYKQMDNKLDDDLLKIIKTV